MCASARHSYRIEYLCSVKSLRIAPSKKSRSDHCAPVAQMDRALASGAKGRGFESLLARHLLNPTAFLRLRMRAVLQFIVPSNPFQERTCGRDSVFLAREM